MKRHPFAKRGNKYGAKRVEVDGHKFASVKEAKRYRELRLLERARLIDRLELQPAFPIVIHGEPVRYESGRPVVYRADFRYRDIEAGGRTVVEDVKGMDTKFSKLKRALVLSIYGIEVRTI